MQTGLAWQEYDLDKLHRAWIHQLVPLALMLVAVPATALLPQPWRDAHVTFALLLVIVTAAIALRVRYALAPTPGQFDRMLRRDGCSRAHSLPWLSFGLVAAGAATTTSSLAVSHFDPSWLYRDPSAAAYLVQWAGPLGFGVASIGWQHPWDATVHRAVAP